MAYISFQPKDHFNTKLYTGTGSSNALTGVGFQPDFTWIKSRSNTYSHTLTDAVRGVTKHNASNNGNAEYTSTTEITSFDSDGFTVGTDAGVNNSSSTFASWNWKANGSGSANTDGTISSTVSANTTAGFSIVKWTGTGSNATIGHGLGVAPAVVMCKRLSGSTQNWFVFHKGMFDTDNTAYINLNTTDGKSQSASVFQSTAPTSTVFSTGTSLSANDYIAYCFANTKGFFKSGVYTGNNSTNGVFINTGFEPALVIVKRYGANGYNWVMLDNKRSSAQGFNPNDKWLYSNNNEVEANQAANPTDFLSNGFKLNNNGSYMNQDSDYLYMAWARESLVASNGDPGTAR